MKKSGWFVLYSAFSIVGAIVGVGFVSGKEIVSFFYKYQPLSLIIAALTCVLFIICAYYGLSANMRCKKRKNIDYELKNINKSEKSNDNLKIKNFNNFLKYKKIILVVMEILVAATMLGGAEVLLVLIGCKNSILNIILMLLIINLIALVCVKFKDGLTRISGIVTILLFAVMIMNLILAVGSGSVNDVKIESVNLSFIFAGVASGIFYASMNMLSCVGVIELTKNKIKSKLQAFIISLISAVVVFVLIVLIVLVYSKHPYIVDEQMPLLFLSANLGGWFYYIYFAIISCGCLSTLVSVACSVFESLGMLDVNVTYGKALLILLLAYIISLVGFEFLVDFVYPLIGMIYLLLAIFTSAITRLTRVKICKNEY